MDDLSLKRALDALPKEIEPPHDDWPQVRARLKRRPASRLRIAALLTLMTVSAAALGLIRQGAGRWTLASQADDGREVHAGERILTAANTARLTVGAIGTVDVDPFTSAELLEARWSSHRLALRRGTIHARIDAPPRLFVVETPSGTAVDLGCAYTLEVDSSGTSRIAVTAGWVSFESHGRAALVPAGMTALMRPGGRLGTPVRGEADPALAAHVAAFDAGAGDSALAGILTTARRLDAVTLWHLVGTTEGAARARVVERLTGLVPPSRDIEPDALLRNDARTMQLYWTELPGTLPIIPGWRRTLWLAWLRVFG